MAVTGIPGMTESTKKFIQAVRSYLRDEPEFNRLVRGYESSDRQIAWAMVDALSEFNGTPPSSAYTLDDLLNINHFYLLLRMTVISLLESIALLQTRNHLNYNDGGISVSVNDKAPLLMNWLNMYRSITEQKLQKAKVALNIQQIMYGGGGVHSEFWAVNSTYYALR